MAICIKDCIQNMNLVIGCPIGCSYSLVLLYTTLRLKNQERKAAG